MDKEIVKQIIFLLLIFSLLWAITDAAFAADMDTAMQECIMEEMQKAGDDVTIGELKSRCQDKEEIVAEKASGKRKKSIVRTRLYTDDKNVLRPWTLMAHRPNYILLAAYNKDPNNEPYREAYDDPSIELENVESQFQVSIKFPLAVDLFKKKVDIFAAYTQVAFWQVYNTDLSSPFRETNYEPEAWVQMRNEWSILGFSNSVNMIGFVHQSNGRSEPLSRSWNRIFAEFIFERGNLVFNIKPWIRIEEDEDDDNNPDITDYLGHYEIGAAYKWRGHTFSIMSRNNLESGFSKGAVELAWSFPLWNYKYLKGYVQGFTGYGQSLVDYNVHHNSIGFGFALTDWL